MVSVLYLNVNGLTIAGVAKDASMALSVQDCWSIWYKWYERNVIGDGIPWSPLPEFANWKLNGLDITRPDSWFIVLDNRF